MKSHVSKGTVVKVVNMANRQTVTNSI